MSLMHVDDSNVQTIEARLTRFKGKEAILRERPLMALVSVQDISVDKDRLKLGGFVIRSRGLWLFKDHWQVDSVWEFVSLHRDCCSSAFCGWSLYLDPQAIKAVTTFGSTLVDLDVEWQRCDTAEKRNSFFNDPDGALWQTYFALALTLDKSARAG
jgi:hypothetical protein